MQNLVKLNNNTKQITTTSNIVAEVFNKPHKDVLKNIRNLDIPENFRGRNFSLSKYQSQNRNGQMLPCYEITKDGFVLLAMGFTGQKAMEWKIKYINAFNAMEKALTERIVATDKPVVVAEHTRALPSGKKEIVLSEKAKTEIGGIVKAVVSSALSESNQPTFFTQNADIMKALEKMMMRCCATAIREEIADYNLKNAVKQTDLFNSAPTADGMPMANWLMSISHSLCNQFHL